MSKSYLIYFFLVFFFFLFTFIPSVNSTLTNCNTTADCNFNGDCYSNICHCSSSYATLLPEEPCNYKRKSQVGAFLLAFFLGEFGAGFFYVGNTTYGLLSWMPMFVFIPLCCCACCGVVSLSEFKPGGCFLGCIYGLVVFIVICLSFFSLGWWIYQIVVMGTNSMPDSNGIYLTPW